jgi:hypothetical protein
MLQIYLYGTSESGFLDVYPGTILDLQGSTDLFDEDLTGGEYSLPVDIPWTEKNRRLMGFIEQVENLTPLNNYWVVDVYDDGFPELVHAKLSLLEKVGKWNYTSGKFSTSISGNKGLFGTRIKNKNLKDIALGGPVSWISGDSRSFATDVMKGVYPQFDYFSFAPVAIEGFFDQGNNYNGEFLAKDTVNYILSTGAGLTDWKFSRPKSTDETMATAPGDVEHIDFRTIPFFKFKYVLLAAFAAAGYDVNGELLNSDDFNDAHIFNTTAIDFFSTAVYLDYTKKFFPADHVPDMLLADFFKAVFQFFNIFPVFAANQVTLTYRKNVFTNAKIVDVTNRCLTDFDSLYTDTTDNTGYLLDYKWDDKDNYRSDRVKDLTTKTLCATVATRPNLDTLAIGRPLTTDDIAFVTAENMYYNVANASSLPILWDAWGENLDVVKTGDGSRTVSAGMGTLCTYVEFDEAAALYVRRNRVASRQPGSYWNNKYVKIKNSFTLRLFYIKKQLISGNELPQSFNHSTAPAGTVLEKYSLALATPQGIAANFHSLWQQIKEVKETVKLSLLADKKLMEDLAAANFIRIRNTVFLIPKTETTLPLQPTIILYAIPSNITVRELPTIAVASPGGGGTVCVNVGAAGSIVFPDANTGSAYYYSITLTGTAPFVYVPVDLPTWLTGNITGDLLEFTGTPADADAAAGVTVQFQVTNCSAGFLNKTDSIDVRTIPRHLRTVNYTSSPGAITDVCTIAVTFNRTSGAQADAATAGQRVQATYHLAADNGCEVDVVVIFETGDTSVSQSVVATCGGTSSYCSGVTSVACSSLLVIP